MAEYTKDQKIALAGQHLRAIRNRQLSLDTVGEVKYKTDAQLATEAAKTVQSAVEALNILYSAEPGTTPAPTPPPAPAPSGIERPGWVNVFNDDLTKGLPADWVTYQGVPGGSSGKWQADQVVVKPGEGVQLKSTLVNGVYVTGGIGRWRSDASELLHWNPGGKIEMDVLYNVKVPGYLTTLLLWPFNEGWPVNGEIDFWETADPTGATANGTFHYGANNLTKASALNGDFTRVRTVGCEWIKDRITWTLDGQPWGSPVSIDGSIVNTGSPMLPTAQMQSYAVGNQWVPKTSAPTEGVLVKAVRGYRKA